MHMRSLLIASLAGSVSSAAIAEPAKPPAAPTAAQPARSRPPQVLLASAEQAQSAATASNQPAPAKRPRTARVTSCRCGDQAVEPTEPTDDSDQD